MLANRNIVYANCPAITLTGSPTWKSGRYITSHIPYLIIRSSWTKFQRAAAAASYSLVKSYLRQRIENLRGGGETLSPPVVFDRSFRSRIRVKLFFPFFFSLFFLRPIHERESPLRRYSTGQWVLIDRSLGGPFERGHNAKWREIGGWLVGRRGGDQGGRKKKRKKKGRDRETIVLLLGNDPFKLDEKF